MYTLATVIYVTVKLILRVYWYLLFARGILSWFPVRGNAVTDLVFVATEFVLAPVRALLERFMGRVTFPIDLSFTVVFILITILLNVF